MITMAISFVRNFQNFFTFALSDAIF